MKKKKPGQSLAEERGPKEGLFFFLNTRELTACLAIPLAVLYGALNHGAR